VAIQRDDKRTGIRGAGPMQELPAGGIAKENVFAAMASFAGQFGIGIERDERHVFRP
jgi:hypothetical protein